MHRGFRRTIRIIVSFSVALLMFAGSAAAQDAASTPDAVPLDPNAIPDHGIAAGAVGFSPDPFRVQAVTGGGEINAASRNLGTDCFGMIAVQPDFRFTALSDFEALRFVFVADTVAANASLIIRDANGNYWCNNDSYGVFHPTITISPAPAGDYNVWVGSLSARVMGDLYVTTRLDVTPSSTGLVVPRPTAAPTLIPSPTPIPPDSLNYTLPATYGTETLAAGFLPDPYWLTVKSGGTLDVDALALGVDCVGYATAEPTFVVNWSGVSTRLNFLVAPLDHMLERNAALIVRDPHGNWRCDDDVFNWLNQPQVEFINPVNGTYYVWVSAEEAPNNPLLGILFITEKPYTPGTITSVGTPPIAEPINGLIPGTSAFMFNRSAPDPYAVPGSLGGGDINIGEQNRVCPGMYTLTPSFGFILPEPTIRLRIFFAADEPRDDATLIVRMPDGRWYCNDDAFNSRQPSLDVVGNESVGVVSIWVGSYNEGESIPGSIYITRGNANPRDPLRPPPMLED